MRTRISTRSLLCTRNTQISISHSDLLRYAIAVQILMSAYRATRMYFAVGRTYMSLKNAIG